MAKTLPKIVTLKKPWFKIGKQIPKKEFCRLIFKQPSIFRGKLAVCFREGIYIHLAYIIGKYTSPMHPTRVIFGCTFSPQSVKEKTSLLLRLPFGVLGISVQGLQLLVSGRVNDIYIYYMMLVSLEEKKTPKFCFPKKKRGPFFWDVSSGYIVFGGKSDQCSNSYVPKSYPNLSFNSATGFSLLVWGPGGLGFDHGTPPK